MSSKANNKKIDLLKKAKNYCFLLLKFRLRSENEIYQRLKKKKFDEGIIKDTLAFLKEESFVDDDYFAKVWIESRIKKPLGLRRLAVELRAKGVNNKIIDSQINQIKKDYPEEEIVIKIAQNRFQKLRGIEPQKAKRRIQDYLIRRGFSPDIIIDVIRQL